MSTKRLLCVPACCVAPYRIDVQAVLAVKTRRLTRGICNRPLNEIRPASEVPASWRPQPPHPLEWGYKQIGRCVLIGQYWQYDYDGSIRALFNKRVHCQSGTMISLKGRVVKSGSIQLFLNSVNQRHPSEEQCQCSLSSLSKCSSCFGWRLALLLSERPWESMAVGCFFAPAEPSLTGQSIGFWDKFMFLFGEGWFGEIWSTQCSLPMRHTPPPPTPTTHSIVSGTGYSDCRVPVYIQLSAKACSLPWCKAMLHVFSWHPVSGCPQAYCNLCWVTYKEMMVPDGAMFTHATWVASGAKTLYL